MVTKKRIPPPEESCFSKLFGKKKEERPMSMNQSKQEHADTWEKEAEAEALKAALKKAVDDLGFLERSGHVGNIEASIVRSALAELRPLIDSEQPQKEERK